MNDREQISWLDYTVINNPTGVMKVVNDYGYIGPMQPQSIDDLELCALDIMNKYGDQGTIDVLKAHPEYLVFKDIFSKNPLSFNNTVGNTFPEKLSNFINRSPVNKAFVALGVFVLAYYIISQIGKKPELWKN
jgi:hypothetical protein